MKKSLFLSMVALSALVFSCKKDDDKSNAEKIQGKWNVLSVYDNNYYGGSNHRDTSTYATGTYTIEFTNNGKYVESGPSWSDTSVYKVEGSNVIVDTDTLQIRTLTSSDLQLYTKYYYSTSSYYEATANLKK